MNQMSMIPGPLSLVHDLCCCLDLWFQSAGLRAPGNRAPLKNLENINQFPYIIQPGNVFFMHMILMDSVNELEMNLGDTYFVTENATERLY